MKVEDLKTAKTNKIVLMLGMSESSVSSTTILCSVKIAIRVSS